MVVTSGVCLIVVNDKNNLLYPSCLELICVVFIGVKIFKRYVRYVGFV